MSLCSDFSSPQIDYKRDECDSQLQSFENDRSQFFSDEVEYQDFSNMFNSSSISSESLAVSEKNIKHNDRKVIVNEGVEAINSDMHLKKLMEEDVNISPWLRFGIEINPWEDSEMHCLPKISSKVRSSDHTLKPEQILANAKNLKQTPDKKSFALSKLELKNKELEDISILSSYRCFQYIDLSWNKLTNLDALNQMVYLMHLDASHNSLQIAIGMTAPWYLTYINLSYNKISIIEDLTNFWSLRHINFSHNGIEVIQGLEGLKYLRYLDLSHNDLTHLKNLGNLHLIHLNLENNKISDWEKLESGCIAINPEIKVINLNNNLMQTIEPFKDLAVLEELSLGYNEISGFDEIDYLKNKKMMKNLTLKGNKFSTIDSYRLFILHYIPNIDSIDGEKVSLKERETAYKFQINEAMENKYELQARLLMYEQLANAEKILPEISMDQMCVPFILLVGPYGSFRAELMKKLMKSHSDKLHYARHHICFPEILKSPGCLEEFECDHVISRSQFNKMMIDGEFLASSNFIGLEFGLSKMEYIRGIEEGKIIISVCDLTIAFCLQALGFNIHMILCINEDIELRNERIASQCRYRAEEEDNKTSILRICSYLLQKMFSYDEPPEELLPEEKSQSENSSSVLAQVQSDYDSDEGTELTPFVSFKSQHFDIGKHQQEKVIQIIIKKVEESLELYEEWKSCEYFTEVIFTDNLDEAYASLKDKIRSISVSESSWNDACSLQEQTFYNNMVSRQKKAMIKELNSTEAEFLSPNWENETCFY